MKQCNIKQNVLKSDNDKKDAEQQTIDIYKKNVTKIGKEKLKLKIFNSISLRIRIRSLFKAKQKTGIKVQEVWKT